MGIHQLALGLDPLRQCLLRSPTQRCRSRATVEVSVGALAGIGDDLRLRECRKACFNFCAPCSSRPEEQPVLPIAVFLLNRTASSLCADFACKAAHTSGSQQGPRPCERVEEEDLQILSARLCVRAEDEDFQGETGLGRVGEFSVKRRDT